MTKISREEVKKIAQISALAITDEEIESMMRQLEAVLSYAERVQEIATEVEEPSIKNVNVFRADSATQTDSQELLERAPEREERFFVVPSILEDK